MKNESAPGLDSVRVEPVDKEASYMDLNVCKIKDSGGALGRI